MAEENIEVKSVRYVLIKKKRTINKIWQRSCQSKGGIQREQLKSNDN